MTVARTREPLGNPKYWPLYEAAEAHGLPIVIHVGSSGTAPVTGVGWPSYFIEQHMSLVHPYIAHVVSLVFNGVFDRFPRLKVVLEEGGIAWMPSLMWRLDRAWRMFPGDSRLESSPSTVIRKHFWFTTQPIDEAEKPEYFAQMLNHLDMDENVVFATDYPHWDFDSPDRALPAMVAGERRKKIMRTNALALYRFPSQPSSKE
jgi:predicted TIM-barrel fold metal-dependent hydrolase